MTKGDVCAMILSRYEYVNLNSVSHKILVAISITYTTLYDLTRLCAWPTKGVPFDGLMGKGNQLLVTQTV